METRQKSTRRKLLKESDLDSSIRLPDAVRDSPTCHTPPVHIPPPRTELETDDFRVAREKHESSKDIVATIYSKGRHRKWAKAVRQHQLGGDYFGDATDVSKLAKMVIAIKSEMSTTGLNCDVFDLDNPTLGVQRTINQLLYDTLTYVIEPDSVAYGYLLGTDSATDRDGRRALVDLITAVRRRYTPGTAAAVGVLGDESTDPRVVGFNPGERKAIPKCPRCPTAGDGHKYHAWADCPLGGKKYPSDSTAAYSQPVEDCSTEEMHTLALCQVFQSASDGGAAAFAAAVELHGAPAVVGAGAASGGVDISDYGFTTGTSGASGDDDVDVHEELRDLRQQIGTALSMGHVSVPHAQPPSFAGVSAAVPSAGGAFSGACGAASSVVAHYSPPTEEFPGGIELVPVRHHVKAVSIDPPVSAVTCSFQPTAASFVGPGEKSRAPIDDMFSDMDEEESPPPIDGGPRAAASCGVSAWRPQQVVGCGVPPFGMRPHFRMLACFIGLLCFGIAGAAAGLGDTGH
ncbi:hypothetical protein CYMTET_43760 [Cymbomonas tetramitiformis]|uniref:Uncharacterized protein n=1 Tax=Cymbomonas tetramitiformis TaxID=36881 RepID=A0AAE0F0B5_9CHLO|nr:hypothetical protein CYMTET_43760 [Cymbomonas tetramitiformis]